jgi:hypothetical protein
MPSTSKSQQRLMGMVYAYKKGDLDLNDLSPSLAQKIKDIADGKRRKTGDRRKKTDGISLKKAKEFASTKHKGLPEKVEESIITKFDIFIKENNTMDEGLSDTIESRFNEFLNEKKGEKLTFEDWWKRSYEKKSDYWISKTELRQGYLPNELTHYYEKKLKNKYNKYLKKRKI